MEVRIPECAKETPMQGLIGPHPLHTSGCSRGESIALHLQLLKAAPHSLNVVPSISTVHDDRSSLSHVSTPPLPPTSPFKDACGCTGPSLIVKDKHFFLAPFGNGLGGV